MAHSTSPLLAALIVCLWTAALADDCVNEGQLRATEQWYEDILSAKYAADSTLELTFMVMYSQKVSLENPIQLLLYKENYEKSWNASTPCSEKVQAVKDSKSGEVMTLNEEKFSSCERNSSTILRCYGRRSFTVKEEDAKYILSVARCTSATIQMVYGFTFSGYSSECSGWEEPDVTVKPKTSPPAPTDVTTTTAPQLPSLATLTAITSVTLAILVLSLIGYLCIRLKVPARMSSTEVGMTRLQNNSHE